MQHCRVFEERGPPMSRRRMLTAVVPCHNEAAVLPLLQVRLSAALDAVDADTRILYVDDGSTDGTTEALLALAQAEPRVGVIVLSRNFGKEAALTAGLDHAAGDAVVVLDADLQDPPELIATLWAHYLDGHDVVYGVRRSRAGESWAKRATARAFYRTIGRLSRTPVPADTGDFRLLSRRALDALKALRERHRFMKGLFGWVGFRQVGVPYDRAPRAAGSTKWNYWKLWNFALEGITSFSAAPLKLATYVGVLTALAAFGFGAWIVFKTLVWGDPVAGYPSLMTVVLFLGGIQLIALGLVGEYLGRLYEESKQRPLYLVDRAVAPRGAEATTRGGQEAARAPGESPARASLPID
jgi:glycosyltransferase involved in cell wall biosynthesis